MYLRLFCLHIPFIYVEYILVCKIWFVENIFYMKKRFTDFLF